MELSGFIKVIKKQKITVVIVPVVTVIITYFLVRNQPDTYSSQAKIATGIVDKTQKSLYDMAGAQESEINQEFTNLVEMLRSKRLLDQVGYQLMIHDLTSATPYRKPSDLMGTLNADAKKHAVAVYSNMYKNRQSLSLFNADQKGLYKLMASMKYDDESMFDKLQVYRVQNSDYINVVFDSENAELSAIVVNKLCSEFVNYYGELVKSNQQKSIDFLANLLRVKMDTLNLRVAALKDYKTRNHVLNLNEKAKALYGQMADFESKREDVEKVTRSTQATMDSIDRQFNPKSRRYSEGDKIEASQKVLSAQTQLHAADDAYIQGGFDPARQRQMDSLRNVIASNLLVLSDKYVLNPLSTKKDLVDQRLSLKMQNSLAQNSSTAVNREIARLNTTFDKLVPHEAATQALERQIDIASQEYMEILQKYNQASLESSFNSKLRVLETAEPGKAAPSKKMLLVIISGVGSFIVCIGVLFIIFFLDGGVKNARDLANATQTPVLGNLNLLPSRSIDLKSIWEERQSDEALKKFKDLMRSARFEIDSELSGDKILLVNSIAPGEGKTFVTLNLAYAYAQVNKKVLVIDGNFDNPDITRSVKPKLFLEDVLNGGENPLLTAPTGQKITFMGNKGGDISILEVSDETTIHRVLQSLKDVFDIIIVEAPPLNALNRSKEMSLFAEKILTVFEANRAIKQSVSPQLQYLKGQKGKFIGWVINLVSNDELISE